MGSSDQGLTSFQRDVLREFFRHTRDFALAGGGALIEFHLHHRDSKDLDLFTRPPTELASGRRAIEAAAASLGAMVEPVTTYPDFQRVLVRRGEKATIVDLVVDRSPPVDPVAVEMDGLMVQPLREIVAGKLGALLGRCEIRDFVDLHALLAQGLDLERALRDAAHKDAGMSPAVLAWLLDSMHIGPDAVVPGRATPAQLESFRKDLVQRLRALSWPDESPSRPR